MTHPKVLIVGTVPYDPQESSRAFDAYFHDWESENLAQIFSNPNTPRRGHCATLYQITDARMLRRWLRPDTQTGRVFRAEQLSSARQSSQAIGKSSLLRKAYQLGGRHTALTHLMRGVLWRKPFWRTEALDAWMDAFAPECVFLAFSDDYFILSIALYAAERYGIPIVSCIGDDYYFNTHFSVDPVYLLYKSTYRALVRRVLKRPGSAIYISDKIRDKYNPAFGLAGETVYLTSGMRRKAFKPIDTEHPVITYFGNVRMGRDRSLCDIADALGSIDAGYMLEVYSNEKDEKKLRLLKAHPHIRYMGSVPYEQVCRIMEQSDITVIVEGFRKQDVELSRYSLSTKAADALASGAAILTYGSAACGIVSYMEQTGASMVCTDRDELRGAIERLLHDTGLLRRYYERQIAVTNENHTLKRSCQVSLQVISDAIQRGI